MSENNSGGRRVLLVDDDPVVLRIYGRGLAQHGLQVETATDGLLAMKALRSMRPEAVVLDLMMPLFSGLEVLKFIRSDKALASLPVVVLSNAYMEETAGTPTMPGAQKALLKFRCTPALLAKTIEEVIASGAPPTPVPALPLKDSTAPAQPSTAAPKSPPPASPVAAPRSQPSSADDAELLAKAREDFLHNARNTCAGVRQHFEGWDLAPTEKERNQRLQDFYRRVHFMSASAGLAQCHRVAVLATVLEGLLFQIMDQPARATAPVRQAIKEAIEFLESLFRELDGPAPEKMPNWSVLVVDADAKSNRLLVWALRQSGLQARSTENPEQALTWLQQKPADLVLVATRLPGIDGSEFVKRIATLPGCKRMLPIYLADECAPGGTPGPTGQVLRKNPVAMELVVRIVVSLLKANSAAQTGTVLIPKQP
jgi:CheY-like chemotaxis protein